MSAAIRVFLVDDHDLVREGLSAILNREPDLEVVGQARSSEEAIEALAELRPDVAVLDHRLPGADGIELCRDLVEQGAHTQIVILSAFIEQTTVDAALRAGARAYVIKDVEPRELVRAIRAAARGETVLDPKVAGSFTSWAIRLSSVDEAPVAPAKLRLLARVVEGISTAEIAAENGLTVNTVKSYLREIYRELGVGSRAEAAALALRQGWI